MNRKGTYVTPFAALEKIKKWCAYQERSQFETRKKLMEFGLRTEEAEAIVSELISENFINEERFAKVFASGKFRIKRWGKTKIKAALKAHHISDYCIKKALVQLEGEDYLKSLEKVIMSKLTLLNGEDRRRRFHSVLKFALSKGYERDLVIEQLNLILDSSGEYEFRPEE